jgi:hypothetical protein
MMLATQRHASSCTIIVTNTRHSDVCALPQILRNCVKTSIDFTEGGEATVRVLEFVLMPVHFCGPRSSANVN